VIIPTLAMPYCEPMTAENLLIIFAKNPVLGHCKTRLAAGIGAQNALEVYKILLAHTAKISHPLACTKVVFYSQEVIETDLWEPEFFKKKLQAKGDLGQKMAQAFEWGFEQGYKKIVLIGTDLIDLEAADIQQAFKALETVNTVFGPATDGGYYLIGQAVLQPALFTDIPWSTAAVLEKSLALLPNHSYELLETKNDIDQIEDLKNIPVFLPFIAES